MLESIKNLFVDENIKLNFKSIKSELGMSRQHKDNEIKKILTKLELEGILFCDEFGNYQKFPSNFLIAQIHSSLKGKPFIILNNEKVYLDPEYLDGIVFYDTVVFTKMNDKYIPIKVVKRHINQVVCEVKINDDNQKYLEVCNMSGTTYVRIDHKNMKKLVEGERVLVELSTEISDNYYDAAFIKRIGHKNDMDTELKTIAYNNGFITDYNEEILEEIEKIPTEISEEDLMARVDKRDAKIFTIDCNDTKDIDDALEIKQLANGNFLLTVSIAHVSHYVKPGSALWEFAEYNTTSLYFADSVLAMLHAKLSNGICSLNPNEDRLARSFEMEINPYGDVVNFKTYKSVIHSRKKMTYDEVNQILEYNNVPEGYEDFVDELKLLYKLSLTLSLKRLNAGAIDLKNREIKWKINDDGKIEKDIREQGSAEKLIENCMVITNVCVGEYYSNMLLPFVYRNHEFPSYDKVKEVYKLIKNLGYRLDKINFTDDSQMIQKVICSLISSLSDEKSFDVLSIIILQALQRAYYNKENHGHFGLAVEYYSQSTSPIRRFLDLVIHTLIDYYESINNDIVEVERLEQYLDGVCYNASVKERCADKVEYEAGQLYMVRYMKDRIGEEFYGHISNITSKEISIKTTDLIDGSCFYDLKGTTFTYMPDSKSIKSKRLNMELRIGSNVKVRLADVDLGKRQIKFEIIEYNLEEVLIKNRTKKKEKN